MNILLSYGLVGRGGDAVQVLALAEALRNLGHKVKLVGPSRLRPYEFTGSESRMRDLLRRLPWWGRDLIELAANFLVLRRARTILRRKHFDLVFHRCGIYDFIGPRLARSLPLIAHLDAPFPVERAFRSEGYFRRLHQHAMQAVGKEARLILTVSNASKGYYAKLGLPEEKVIVLPNGISERLLRRGAELAREHPSFSGKAPFVIGFVGSLSCWHRVDLLLEVLRLLDVERPGEFQLEVVGMGEDYGALRALEKELGLESRVRWIGAVPHEEAFEYIAHFDVAVLPHTLATGAPMKLFEYAALARPTIAPDLPNLRVLFSEEEVSFFQPEASSPLAGAILRLVEDRATASQMGIRAQRRAQDYSWEKIVQRILDAVDEQREDDD